MKKKRYVTFELNEKNEIITKHVSENKRDHLADSVNDSDSDTVTDLLVMIMGLGISIFFMKALTETDLIKFLF